MRARAISPDYDTNPARFRANVRTVKQYGVVDDVHEEVAGRIVLEGLLPALDLGCGEGRLTKPLDSRNAARVAFDYSPTMLSAVPDPRVRGDANCLPFRDGAFGSVAALYMLYHLDEPRRAIAESQRVLRLGGLFVASAPSFYDSPELADFLPASSPMTFDAEKGPEMVREYFEQVEVERWDGLFVHLPDAEALSDYLQSRRASEEAIAEALNQINLPLHLTKRGALIYGHKL